MQKKGFEFSDFFKSLLKEVGLNYADFTKISGISRRAVANWANSNVIPEAASFKVSLQALAKRLDESEQKTFIDKNYAIYQSIADTVNFERSKKR